MYVRAKETRDGELGDAKTVLKELNNHPHMRVFAQCTFFLTFHRQDLRLVRCIQNEDGKCFGNTDEDGANTHTTYTFILVLMVAVRQEKKIRSQKYCSQKKKMCSHLTGGLSRERLLLSLEVHARDPGALQTVISCRKTSSNACYPLRREGRAFFGTLGC